ncbi:hypothetical protein [Limnohabitans sp. T6-5]|uniref:hypothetical protein n=1 Tax=Limnohabitans sp. T6-5 TaxID=1100724 RepID=UPI001E50EA6C|nr:hypothetical protein [Limnohabitans sp. T6-5]
MTPTPETPPVPNYQNAPHEADPMDLFMPALQDAIEQLEVMHDAWWRVNDALLLLHNMETVDPAFMPDALADLEVLRVKIGHLKHAVRWELDEQRQRMDARAVQAMTRSPEDTAALRTQLAQADLNLSTLYQHLLQLGKQCGQPLVQELSGHASGFPPPMWDAEVRVSLDYMLNDDHPLYDDRSNNHLARQEPINWHVNAEGVKSREMDDDPQQDNWLDYKHAWMSRQGWLTHDVLEHNYGHHPHFGVAALLHTGFIWVEVNTVRSYVFDLNSGRFIAQEK